MAQRRKRAAVPKVNTKLLVDIIVASIIVDKAPAFINNIMPVNPQLAQFTGVGAGWLTGWLAKRPDISNASLALGVTSLINPMIDGITAQIPGGSRTLPVYKDGSGTVPIKKIINNKMERVSDFISLNDYQRTPGVNADYSNYQHSY